MSIAATPQVRTVNNFLDGEEAPARSGATFEKLSPATGEVMAHVARSNADVPAGFVSTHTGPVGVGDSCTTVSVVVGASATANGSHSLSDAACLLSPL